MAMSTADAWQQGGARPDRSFAGSRPVRPERSMNVENVSAKAFLHRPIVSAADCWSA